MNNFGLKDDSFIRGNVPMTKSEIRALTLIKLKLDNNDVVWDIGAGTGSISIEAALNIKKGKVFAIEKNNEAIQLIKENKNKFQLTNLYIFNGLAPDIFPELPLPTKVIIGGTGGNLTDILNYLWFKTEVKTIVINAITLNTLNIALDFLNNNNAQFDAIQVSINRIKQVNSYHMMQSQNPVFIISTEK